MEALSWFRILVPKTGQNLEPRCESSPQVHQAPRIQYSQLHELLGRSLRIRLLWLASPGQPTGGDLSQGMAFLGFHVLQN